MKKILLKAIKLENYKVFSSSLPGRKDFSCKFGKKTKISGRNGTGKSTIMSAAMEVLTGKNADGTQADNVRPIADGQEVEGVDVERTVVLNIDGKETEIKKITKQKRERVDGVMQYVPGSNVNSYTVDGISFNQKKLDEFISENICQPETLLACCNPNAFLSLKSTTDMRAFLEKMAGFDLNEYIKSLGSEFAEIEEITKGHPIEQVQKTLNKQLTDQKKATTKAETEWKYEKSKEVSGNDEEVDRLQKEKAGYEKEILSLDSQDKSLDDVMAAYDQKSKDILDLKFEQSEIVRKANVELVNQKKRLNEDTFLLEQEKKSAENDLRMAEIDLKHANMGIERHKAEVQKAQEDWKTYSEREYPEKNLEKIKAEQFDESSLICPTCGQDLPEDKAQKIRDDFEENKSIRIQHEEAFKKTFYETKDRELTEITETGNKAVADLKEAKKAKEETERKISTCRQNIADFAIQIQTKTKKLAEIPESVDLSDNAEYQKITAEIEVAEEALKQMNNGSEQRREIADKRNGYIRECAKIEAEINNINREKQAHDEEVERLYQAFRESSQKEANIQQKKDILKNFSIKKNERIASLINPVFKEFQFEFLEYTQSGDPVETCRMVSNGIEYRNMNHSKKILVQADLLKGFQELSGLNLFVFIDDTESVNNENLPDMDRQVILLKVTDNDLKVEVME